MFEKPKTLNELSEYELQNLLSYLADAVPVQATVGESFLVTRIWVKCLHGSMHGCRTLNWNT